MKIQTKGKKLFHVTVCQSRTYNVKTYIIIGGTIVSASKKALKVAREDRLAWNGDISRSLYVIGVKFDGTVDN